MSVKIANRVSGVLAADVTAGATSITVTDAADFPVLAANEWMYLTVDNEVIKVTATSGTTFTCDALTTGHTTSSALQMRQCIDVLEDIRVEGSMPINGITSQVLSKVSDTDFDAEWVDPENIGMITEDTTIYIKTTGVDATADGSSNAPFYSLAAAVEMLLNFKVNPFAYVTFSIAVGTYIDWPAVYLRGPNVKNWKIIGEGADNTDVICTFIENEYGILVYGTTLVELSGFTIKTPPTSSAWKVALYIQDNGTIQNCYNMDFSWHIGRTISLEKNSSLYSTGNITIDKPNAAIVMLDNSYMSITGALYEALTINCQLVDSTTFGAMIYMTLSCVAQLPYAVFYGPIYEVGIVTVANINVNSFLNISNSEFVGTMNFSPNVTTTDPPIFGNTGSWILV